MKLNVQEFAKRIKEKYPEYKAQDNHKLVQAVLKKHPVYKDRVEEPTGADLVSVTPTVE